LISVFAGREYAINSEPNLEWMAIGNASTFSNCQGDARKKRFVHHNVAVGFLEHSDLVFAHG
jgi:hypothetical protein